LNEASVLTSIKNWLSGNFGGAVEKLDSLILAIKKAETGYIGEWEDVVSEIDQLEIKLQGDVDAAQEKSTLRMIERKKQILSAIKKKKEKELENIFRKVEVIKKGNKRLSDYWEKEKAQADADIAKRMYDIAKSLGDDEMASDLYDKYKKFLDKSTRLESVLSKKYKGKLGKLSDKEEELEKSEGSLSKLSKKPLGEFSDSVKDLDPKEARELMKICTEERNRLYVDMDLEVSKIEEEIKKKKDRDFEIEAERNIKKIKEKYLEKIREFRSKITLAKRYS
jgi:uncharacterized phage infection (PIP) family protein YhgE